MENKLLMTKEEACKKVAQDYRDRAIAMITKDEYAAHVTEETKKAIYEKDMKRADEIEKGIVDNFAVWQMVNYYMTGECVAFLPK